MSLAVTSAFKSPTIGPQGGIHWNAPVKFNYWYAAIVDLMLAEPDLKQYEIATKLNRSPTWLGIVMSTDMFKAYYAMRRQAFEDALSSRISGKLSQATEAALDSLIEGIQTKGMTLGVLERKEVADTLLQRLGMGMKQASGVTVNVQQNSTEITTSVSAEVLHAARGNLRAMEELRLSQLRSATESREALPSTTPLTIEHVEV